MDVIGQHHHRVDLEGQTLPRYEDRLLKRVDILDQKLATPIKKIDREEPAATSNERATIIRHGS